MMKPIYLDYAATTPADPAVVQAMIPYFHDAFGNPSAIYSYGQEAKSAIEKARSAVCKPHWCTRRRNSVHQRRH